MKAAQSSFFTGKVISLSFSLQALAFTVKYLILLISHILYIVAHESSLRKKNPKKPLSDSRIIARPLIGLICTYTCLYITGIKSLTEDIFFYIIINIAIAESWVWFMLFLEKRFHDNKNFQFSTKIFYFIKKAIFFMCRIFYTYGMFVLQTLRNASLPHEAILLLHNGLSLLNCLSQTLIKFFKNLFLVLRFYLNLTSTEENLAIIRRRNREEHSRLLRSRTENTISQNDIFYQQLIQALLTPPRGASAA